MKVLSYRAKSSSGDEIPLNKSFESPGTSDQFLERDNNSVSTVEPVTEILNVTAIQNSRRPSFASTETLKVRNSARSMPKLLHPALSATLYSPNLSTMLESSHDFSDEPEPRAVVVPRPAIIQSHDTCEEDECKSEFFDNMIPMKKWDLNRRWKIEARSSTEENNNVATDTVLVEQAKFVAYDQESSEDFVDEMKAHADASSQRAEDQEAPSKCNEIVWKAWGCNDLTTRRHGMCFLFLFFLLVVVIALLIGAHSMDRPAQRVSAANSPQGPDDDGRNGWIGDQPDNKPSENTPKPKPRPTIVSRPAPIEPTRSPTEFPVLPTTAVASPGSSTQQPALSAPESGVSPSSWSMIPSAPFAPTAVTTRVPTVKPTGSLATNIPTNGQRMPTSSPSGQPSICQSSLTVDKSCYVEEEDLIEITFVNCNPKEGDWVGIWRTREDSTNPGQGFLRWAWSCGTKNCQGSPVSKRMAFDAYGLDFDSFQAFLVHNPPDDTPYVVEAMSKPFVVANFCA